MTPAGGGGGGGTQAQHERGSFSCPCCPRLWSPDVGLNAHAAVLQTRVHCEVNGVGGFPAVVLMDQHGVLCDVMARSIPGNGTQLWTHVYVRHQYQTGWWHACL